MPEPVRTRTREEEDLRALLHDVHRQLAERDAMIERLLRAPDTAERQELDRERERLRLERETFTAGQAEAERLRTALAQAEGRAAAMAETRVWRLACHWWRLKGLRLGG